VENIVVFPEFQDRLFHSGPGKTVFQLIKLHSRKPFVIKPYNLSKLTVYVKSFLAGRQAACHHIPRDLSCLPILCTFRQKTPAK
jgi:hypothetical protein